MGSAQGIQSQNGFRGRADTVEESSDTTWFAPLNTNWVALALDTNFRVRFEIKLISISQNFNTGFYELWYSHNAGSLTRVTPTSSVIKTKATNVAGYDYGDDTTQLLRSGSFLADNNQVAEGWFVSDQFTWPLAGGAPQYVETEWTLQLIGDDLSNGDTVELRMRKFGGGAFAGGYAYSPIISVQKPQVEIKGGEFIIDGKELVIQ